MFLIAAAAAIPSSTRASSFRAWIHEALGAGARGWCEGEKAGGRGAEEGTVDEEAGGHLGLGFGEKGGEVVVAFGGDTVVVVGGCWVLGRS